MSSANPPPPFDADAARRLCEKLWQREWGMSEWDGMNAIALLRAAVAEVERLREQVSELEQELDNQAFYKNLG
jgi:hypothetical protein